MDAAAASWSRIPSANRWWAALAAPSRSAGCGWMAIGAHGGGPTLQFRGPMLQRAASGPVRAGAARVSGGGDVRGAGLGEALHDGGGFVEGCVEREARTTRALA